jgi:hypothetical protein
LVLEASGCDGTCWVERLYLHRESAVATSFHLLGRGRRAPCAD